MKAQAMRAGIAGQKKLLSLVAWFFPLITFCQEIEVKGKVTDALTGEAIPFANVVFKNTTTGVTTDFEGNFTLRTTEQVDSIMATSIGYNPRTKRVNPGRQVINFQLNEAVTSLKELVIKSGENPAYAILRKVIQNKPLHDKRNLSAYESDIYTKTEIDISQISEKLRKKKVMKKIAQVLDSIDRVVGEDGKPILPLAITESYSRLYYRTNPMLKSENIINTRINGIGLNDGGSVNQLVGSSFQEYNFYQNWLPILSKNFVSPIADGGRLYYEYDLTDSLYVGTDFCYRIDYFPRSPAELAFKGTIWITKKEYALKQIDAAMDKRANINFIDKIQIQQELMPTPVGAWLPKKNRVLINVSPLSKKSAGMIAKFYSSNKNVITNQPHPLSFYDKRVLVEENASNHHDDRFWDSLRNEPLTRTEKNVYRMIDTVKNLPIVRTYVDIFKVLVQGYYNFGSIEAGPYINSIAQNGVEGVRAQLGFRTNYNFSKKMVYNAMGAYGFGDDRFKYSLGVRRIISRKHWTTVGVRFTHDITRLGLDPEVVSNSPLYLAAARWGKFIRAYYYDEMFAFASREFIRGFSGRVALRSWSFNPTYKIGFPYDSTAPVLNRFKTTEVFLEARYAPSETIFQNGNELVRIGRGRKPAFTLRYTHGFEGVFGSDFDYDKLMLNIDQRVNMGVLGNGVLSVRSEYIFDDLPYPLLTVHLGNRAHTYTPYTFNLMNYGEFASDRSVSMHYRQYFEGLLFNRIPLMNRLKWRLVGTANLIYGSMRPSNQLLISNYTPSGEPALKTGYFTNGIPYVELGYGVENILKLLRIDFVHRLTYLDNKYARKFGILFTVQFKL
ncbi:MAG: carboxypeptidase-like regulatory domain-containing protein [Bacteroidetes bacterium]|nr:carboxypeptidase-like regulatory domain-containing protein [Bacteroidota bacterium]MBS1541069.1 carboxypeptidase-like regulatory domain-containing protein [Bacteroidota bacterium]